jgi:hypothetical protein
VTADFTSAGLSGSHPLRRDERDGARLRQHDQQRAFMPKNGV